jgi:hypothetical protein
MKINMIVIILVRKKKNISNLKYKLYLVLAVTMVVKVKKENMD